MPAVAPPPVRPVLLEEIRAAHDRIRHVITRTPLIRLRHDVAGAPEIWLKLETLQPINAFKIRGGANAVALLSAEARSKGVWTISAGNAGQGVAYAAREAGIPCTVLVIETAPETKVERMRNLGATLVKAPFDACWWAMEDRAYPGIEGTFVHPFDDHDFIAGNGTMGIEIMEDMPQVKTVLAAIGGGGLTTGIASAIKQLAPHVRVMGAEPETAAPGAKSFAANSPQIFDQWQATFVDGAGGKSIFPRMWERLRHVLDGSIVVTLDQVKNAMRLVASKTRVICEGAGALGVAAALTLKEEDGPVVAVVSGGNIDLKTFCEIIA
jgi:threonine dehydratase